MAARPGAFVFAALLMLSVPPTVTLAQEQPLVIVVVDFQKIVRESAAAAAVRIQIDDLRNVYQEEFARIEEELRSVEAELTELRPVLSDEDFLQRRRTFEQRVTEAQRQAQYRRAALDGALDDSMNQIQSALLEAIAAIAKREGANVVLNRSHVILADQTLDFTADALEDLDAILPHVDVVVPEQ